MTKTAEPETSGADDDAALIDVFMRTRSEAAFAALYARHGALLYRVALRIVGGSDADAQDAAQEAWLRAVASLATFSRRSSLRTWLVGIALNCAREQARRRAKHAGSPIELAAPRVDRGSGPIDERLALEQAIAALPDGARAALVLHDVEGFTHEEIGALLGIDPGTSKSQLSRARALLRERWSPREETNR